MLTSRIISGAMLLSALVIAPLSAQTTERISLTSTGAQADDHMYKARVSGNGRFVVFDSLATNLIPGDTNGRRDVFVHDRVLDTIERVSTNSARVECNDDSWNGQLSHDGRYVVFQSDATDLVPNDLNGVRDIFVKDRMSGLTTRVNLSNTGKEADGHSSDAAIDSTGNWVTFVSTATNLSISTSGTQIYLVHVPTGALTLVSHTPDGLASTNSTKPRVSDNGQHVVFESDDPGLDAADTNNARDIFVYEHASGTVQRVSLSSSGEEGQGDSDNADISADGQRVVFRSQAPDLVTGDTNGVGDVFFKDLASGSLTRVNLNSQGQQDWNGAGLPRISGDGTHVSFQTIDDLVPQDTNGLLDIYVVELDAMQIEWVSVDSNGNSGSNHAGSSAVSADGNVVTFLCSDTLLVSGDTNGKMDVFARTRISASFGNYSSGHAGTKGIPSLTLDRTPELGSQPTVKIGNSAGKDTVGLLFWGLTTAEIPTSKDGTLLVIPAAAPLFTTFPAAGLNLPFLVPDDPSLTGLNLYLQTLQADLGASKGVAFSRGLQMQFGG